MIPALLGRKVGMTQIYAEDGTVSPVTVLQVGPCYVTQLITAEKHGYSAVQIGFEDKVKKVNKATTGHFAKSGVSPKKNLSEVRLEKDAELELGQEIGVDAFEEGQKVDVIGVTKGRGFAGTIKRHNFSRGPETHGSMNVRQPGSIGMCSFPSRVFPGKRMAGQLGNRQLTQRGLTVVKIDQAKSLIMVKGPVPGPTGGLIKIRKAVY